MKSKTVLLFSGGFESTLLLNHLIEKNIEIYPVYISLGYSWEKHEFKAAKKIVKFYQGKTKLVKNISEIEIEQKSKREVSNVNTKQGNFIPLRNLLYVTNAAHFAVKEKIASISIGNEKNDGYADNTEHYFETMEKLVSEGIGKKMVISAPFHSFKKEDLEKVFAKVEIPYEMIYSCANPLEDGTHCSKCFKCKQLEAIISKKSKK